MYAATSETSWSDHKPLFFGLVFRSIDFNCNTTKLLSQTLVSTYGHRWNMHPFARIVMWPPEHFKLTITWKKTKKRFKQTLGMLHGIYEHISAIGLSGLNCWHTIFVLFGFGLIRLAIRTAYSVCVLSHRIYGH